MVFGSSVTARKNLANELEKRVEARTAEARRNLEHFMLFMENMPGPAFIKNLAGKYLYANEQMVQFRGREPMECVGKSDHELWPKDIADRIVAKDHRVIQTGKPLRGVEKVTGKNGLREFLTHRFALPDTQGKAEAVAGLGVDVTDLKRALEKEVLLRREINHRVKNNLQVIISLLYLQSTNTEDPRMHEMLRESQSRVKSISLIYDNLTQRGDVAGIDFADYVEQLAMGLFGAYQVRQDRGALKMNVQRVFLGLDTAVPCGLILTELVSNALKHAFPGNRKGEILIGLQPMEDGQF